MDEDRLSSDRTSSAIRRGEVQPLEQLFLEAGVGEFSVQRTAAYDDPISERYHSARSAAALANSSAARTCQDETTSHAIPADKVGSEGVLSQQHRHWIVDMRGRNVSVRVYALQASISLFSSASIIMCFK